MNEGTRAGLRHAIRENGIFPLMGIYDVFSASIAGKYFEGLFVSGFGFAASFYGLPDIGFISWSDIVAFTRRIKTVLPHHQIVVDIDDGYADVEVASHVVSLLEAIGVSGVVLEDQKRPRRCGHLNGKQILNLDDYMVKLKRVLQTRRNISVVARTDATEGDEIRRRVKAFAEAGADAILVDGIKDLDFVRELKSGVDKPFVFNQIAGGKSPSYSLRELKAAGVSLVIYSTPCLFAAQASVEDAMKSIRENQGHLPENGNGRVGVKDCNNLLEGNLSQRIP